MEKFNLYIDANGVLMCGPEERSTSMVEGLKFSHNNEIGSYWDFEIEPINDLGHVLKDNL